LEASAGDDDEIPGDCSWSTIIAGIRRHAADQSDDVRADLHSWADLLEGIAELGARGGD
jgi:hypothetical protein